jgi:hypothetical protein
MPVDSPVVEEEEEETKEQPEQEDKSEEMDKNLEEALLVLKKHNFTATKIQD